MRQTAVSGRQFATTHHIFSCTRCCEPEARKTPPIVNKFHFTRESTAQLLHQTAITQKLLSARRMTYLLQDRRRNGAETTTTFLLVLREKGYPYFCEGVHATGPRRSGPLSKFNTNIFCCHIEWQRGPVQRISR